MEIVKSSPNGQDGIPQDAGTTPATVPLGPAAVGGLPTLPLGPVTPGASVPPPSDDGTGDAEASGATAACGTATPPTSWTTWSADGCTPTDYRLYKQGDTSPFNTKIMRIFGRSRDFLIYGNDMGRLAIHFNDPLPTYMRPALQEYRRLTTIATIALDEAQNDKARELVATGLIHAFSSTEGMDVLAGMAPAKAFIESRAVARARSNLMFVVAATAVVVFTALWLLKYDVLAGDGRAYLPSLLLGGMAGIAGSAISWIQRSADVEIDMYAPMKHRCFQGAMRVLLGMVFGVIVVIAAHSKFAFSIAAGEPYALCMVALAGGFSERLVPDVISRVGQEQASRTTPHGA
jgi:hypothetical protein